MSLMSIGGLRRRFSGLSGYSVIVGVIARITLIIGIVLLIPALVAVIYNELNEAKAFFLVSIIVISSSYLASRVVKIPQNITISEAFVISGISWLLVSFIGALPYLLTINLALLDAYFESMSGFTTTGMTILSNLETLPKSILFWRSLTQWIGGLGILMMFIVLAGPLSGTSILRLYIVEAREIKIRASTWITVRDMWLIYMLYTLLATIVLLFLGMDPFNAVTHAFTALATGGFSTKDSSIAGFNNVNIEAALTFFEFIGATNFLAHYRLFRYGVKDFIKYYEVKYYIILIALASLLVSCDLMFNYGLDALNSLRYSVFQVVAIVTTTGYQTADISIWPRFSKTLLLILMFVGGQQCSTGGSIKLGRLVIAAKVLKNQIERLYLPSAVIKPVKINSHIIDENEAMKILAYISMYILLIIVGTIALIALGYEPFSALSAIASAQGNVGPAYISLYELAPVGKALLVFHMWLGRLEVVPVVALFTPQLWRLARRHTTEST